MQAVRRMHAHLRAAKEAAVERTLPQVRQVSMKPHEADVDEELDQAAEVRTATPQCDVQGRSKWCYDQVTFPSLVSHQ